MVELEISGMAHGGEAVGRLPDGRVCFVPYTLPGERVRVRVVEQRKRYARGELLEVLRAAPERVAAPCPHFGPGRCGGCQLQHVAADAQAQLKGGIVRDLLERIGKVKDPPVAEVAAVTPTGYRSTARFAVDAEGRLGFRRASSHQIHPVDRCLLLDDATQRLRGEVGDGWQGATEVVLRSGNTAAGDVAVVAAGHAPRPMPADGAVTIRVDGFDLRVSARSFFQPGPQGAAVLLRLVREAAAVSAGDSVLELFAGGGLFSRGLVADGAAVTAVEADDVAVGDLRHNLAGHPARIVHGDALRAVTDATASGQQFDVVVLDPPRRGAGGTLAQALARHGAPTIVYVACDPAALARDSRTLIDGGYTLTRVVPVDQFPQTAAIEAVATFRRGADGSQAA